MNEDNTNYMKFRTLRLVLQCLLYTNWNQERELLLTEVS